MKQKIFQNISNVGKKSLRKIVVLGSSVNKIIFSYSYISFKTGLFLKIQRTSFAKHQCFNFLRPYVTPSHERD